MGKEYAEKKIREFRDNYLTNLPVLPEVFTYVKLYEVLQELCTRGEYALVEHLCDAVLANARAKQFRI